jgi:hypothetical protein
VEASAYPTYGEEHWWPPLAPFLQFRTVHKAHVETGRLHVNDYARVIEVHPQDPSCRRGGPAETVDQCWRAELLFSV